MLVCLRLSIRGSQSFARFINTTVWTMSWRGRRGGGSSSYNQNANRLRDKLESRNQTEDDDQNRRNDRPPPGLRGRDLGMWYAQRSKKNNENKLVGFAKRNQILRMI